MSLPSRERELKQSKSYSDIFVKGSLPSRERELKLRIEPVAHRPKGRSPRGSVN